MNKLGWYGDTLDQHQTGLREDEVGLQYSSIGGHTGSRSCLVEVSMGTHTGST